MRGKTVIAGVGHTAFGKHPGRGTLSLNAEAIRKALEDARIEKSLVDALFVKVPTSRYEMMYGQKLAEAIGVQPRVGGVWDQGGCRQYQHDLLRGNGDRRRPVRGRCREPRRQPQGPGPGRPTRRLAATMPPMAGSAFPPATP